eukprot:4134955-Amphidinium_carterae.1
MFHPQEKYTQAKQANVVLKKGLLEKQEEFNNLEKQLKEQESALRAQLEEIDHLQFQNGPSGDARATPPML